MIACAASLPESIARFAALPIHRIDELRGIADHHGAVRENLRQPVVAPFRDEMTRVLERLPPGDQRRDRRVRLEAVEHVVDVEAGHDEIFEERAGADREALLVGVDEAVAKETSGRLAKDLQRGAQAWRQRKTRLDDVRGQRDQLLGHQCLLDWLPLPVQPDLLRQERVRAVGDDDAARQQLALRVAGRDADDGAVLPEQIDDGELRVDLGPGLFRLAGVPAIEGGAQHGVGVERRLGEALRAVGRAHHRVVRQQQVSLLDDRTLQGRFFLEPRHHRLGRLPVENPAPDVLGPRKLPALQHDDREPRGGHLLRRGDPGRPGPHHDGIESIVVHA